MHLMVQQQQHITEMVFEAYSDSTSIFLDFLTFNSSGMIIGSKENLYDLPELVTDSKAFSAIIERSFGFVFDGQTEA